jgi:hypothetical protein
VPVQTIELESPEIKGLAPDQIEVIDHKVSYRLAQRPGSYVVLTCAPWLNAAILKRSIVRRRR